MTLRTRLTETIDRSRTSPSLLVVSDSRLGTRLTTDLDGVAIHLVTDSTAVAAEAPDCVRTTVGELTALETLAPAADAAVAVVALRRDRQALLVSQLLRTQFDLTDIVCLLNDPTRQDAVAAVATTVVCGSSCLAAELCDAIEATLPEPTESHA